MSAYLKLMRVSIFTTLGLASTSLAAQDTQDTGTTKKPDSTLGPIPACVNPQPVLGVMLEDSGYVRCKDGRILRERADWDLPGDVGRPCRYSRDQLNYAGCVEDSECTARPFGACIQDYAFGPGLACRCEYRCMSDLDCKIGEICAAPEVGGREMTQCIRANCRVNADCASGQCEASKNRALVGGEGSVSVGCRSDKDECRTDADCPDQGGCGFCDLNPWKGIWQCSQSCMVVGRPFIIQGEAALPEVRAGADWVAPTVLTPSALSGDLAQRAAAHWLECARMEHASVAAFARFALQLMHLGAPPELLQATSTAMRDEILHAKACFAMAKRYSGLYQSAGTLEVSQSLEKELDPARIAVDVFLEGCVGETVAALEASEMAKLSRDPEVSALLEQIARDEHQHALLAWRSLGWMLETLPTTQVQSLRECLSSITRELLEEQRVETTPEIRAADTLEAHGVPSEARRQRLRRQAITQLVLPCANALLTTSAREPVHAQAPELLF